MALLAGTRRVVAAHAIARTTGPASRSGRASRTTGRRPRLARNSSTRQSGMLATSLLTIGLSGSARRRPGGSRVGRPAAAPAGRSLTTAPHAIASVSSAPSGQKRSRAHPRQTCSRPASGLYGDRSRDPQNAESAHLVHDRFHLPPTRRAASALATNQWRRPSSRPRRARSLCPTAVARGRVADVE